MDAFYKQYPLASYRIHQLWVQHMLDDQREAERKKQNSLCNNDDDNNNNTVKTTEIIEKIRSVIEVVAPSNRTDSEKRLPSLALTSSGASKPSMIEKQPVIGPKPPSRELTIDSAEIRLEKPQKKQKYCREELMEIGFYKHPPPFTSEDYHWAKDLIIKEERNATEERLIRKRKRRDEDEPRPFEDSRYIAPQSLPRRPNNRPRSYEANRRWWNDRNNGSARRNHSPRSYRRKYSNERKHRRR